MFTSSGSADSDRLVNPTRSQNRAVTTLRSSRCPTSPVAKGEAPAPQKRNPSGVLLTPHGGDRHRPRVRVAPRTGRRSAPQAGRASTNTTSPSQPSGTGVPLGWLGDVVFVLARPA